MSSSSSSEEEEEVEDISDDDLSIFDKYTALKQKLIDTKQKMRSLVSNVGEYKNYLELEKKDIQNKLDSERASWLLTRSDLLKQISQQHDKEREMKEHYEELIQEYQVRTIFSKLGILIRGHLSRSCFGDFSIFSQYNFLIKILRQN